MKRFLETKLFDLLSCSVNGEEVDRAELSVAYDDFVRQLLQLIQLYSELSACGVMDSKRKENLKAEITNLIST